MRVSILLRLALLLGSGDRLASSFGSLTTSHYQRISSTAIFAKKPAKRSKKQAASNKGFGAAPPTLEEVVQGFRTRLPETSDVPCPCGLHGKTYKDCCEPYHKDEKQPQSPREVLQTRYSAFCYRLPRYIIATTHPECRDYTDNKVGWAKDLNQSGMFDSYDFVRLEVVEEDGSIDDGEAFVDFRVELKAQAGNDKNSIAIRERSRFLDNDGGYWKYAGGDVTTETSGLEEVKLNP